MVFSVVMLALLVAGPLSANVWIDEDFDDGSAFDSGDIDTYSSDQPIPNPLNLTHTGNVSTVRSFSGTNS